MKRNIPISKAIARMTIKPESTQRRMYYPLYTSYQERYDIQNIKESLDKWNSFSPVLEDNVDKMLELMSIVNEKGTLNEIEDVSKIITRNILSVSEYANFVYQLKQIKNTEPILNAIEEAVICDKVVQNYHNLSNRFNIDEYIQEHAYGDNFAECIYELCSFIDTYNAGINTKYCMALDEIQFGFVRNGIKYPNSKIVEQVSTYFLTNIMDPKDRNRELLDVMESTIDSDPFFLEDDKAFITYCKSLRAVKEKEEFEPNPFDIENEIKKIDETSVIEESASDVTKAAIAKFKMLPKKTGGAFKILLKNLLVVKREEDIIDDSYNILSVSFYFVIVAGTIAISVWVGAIAMVVAFITSQHFNWETIKKVLSVWYKHRSKIANKLDKEKNPAKKKKLEEYLKEIDKYIERIETQYDKLKPEDSEDAYSKRPSNYGSSDDEFGFNLESALFSTDQNVVNEAIHKLSDADIITSIMENISWDKTEMTKFFNEKFFLTASNSNIQFVAEFALKYPTMFEPITSLAIAMEDAAWSIKSTKNADYERIGHLRQWAYGIREEAKSTSLNESSDNMISDLEQLYASTKALNEYVQYFNELGIDSHIKLAIDKMIDTAKSIDVKAQVAARTIDGASRLISKSIERAFTMENREAVIRGEILPPLSKCIKIAIVTGGLFLINPALALVALVVRFAVSKRVRTKERQLVLNELDVELTMIDKYIQQDEAKGDMKKLREHLLLKKKFQAQYSRLRYNIKVEWNDKDVDELRGKTDD